MAPSGGRRRSGGGVGQRRAARDAHVDFVAGDLPVRPGRDKLPVTLRSCFSGSSVGFAIEQAEARLLPARLPGPAGRAVARPSIWKPPQMPISLPP
jgi:hypothetical protein